MIFSSLRDLSSKVGWPPNGGVEAAARFPSTFAGQVMMRNTLQPVSSNDFRGIASVVITAVALRQLSADADILLHHSGPLTLR